MPQFTLFANHLATICNQVTTGNNHMSTGSGKLPGDTCTDTTAAPGDDGNLIFQFHFTFSGILDFVYR